MYKRKFNADGVFADRGALRMVNAGGAKSTTLRLGTTRRYKAVPKAFKAMVNRAVSRTEEKKESNLYSLNSPLPSTANAGWTASSISIAPSSTGFVIPQGVGQGQRVGNHIRTKRATVKGILHQNPFDAVTNNQPLPLQVRMLIFKDKFNKSGQPAAVSLDLFQTGSTAIGPTNDLADIMLDINRDRYQVYHDQVMKVGFASYQGTGTLPIFQSFTNNDFSLNCEFSVDITKFIPKQIMYNDGGAAPMNDNLWMIFIPCVSTGASLGANSTLLNMSWSATYEYTDA